jgi:hypothetical protein
MIKRLFVIGDSFVIPCKYVKGYTDGSLWVDIVRTGLNIDISNSLIDGLANRDVQTIVDNWIKLLPNLKSDDLLIICLPFFQRTRLPLAEHQWIKSVKSKDIKVINRFVGPQMAHLWDLEFWGKEYNTKEWMSRMKIQEIINSSNASILNSIEVIESLVKITHSKLFVFTWDEMVIKSDAILDKTYFESNIGKWHTFDDDYKESNGEHGKLVDFHWSFSYNKLVAEHLINKFGNPKYL